MPFPKKVREEALLKASRHCCVCHDFVGRSVNVHHIKPEADGGANTIENAIVLCLRCHAEAGHFNSRHPMGTKYSPSELAGHRDAWFEACERGTATYSSTVEVRAHRTYTSSDLHQYVLLFDFHNGNKNVVTGWKLDVFLPRAFTVKTGEVDELLETEIDGVKYRKFQVTGNETLYLGESCELTDPEWAVIRYDIDWDIYDSARRGNPRIPWIFYSSSEPPIKGELQWDEIQEF